MKSFIITLLFLGLPFRLIPKTNRRNREEGLMKVEELPAVVIKRIGADFSVYIPDNHPDKDVRRLEENLLPTILVRTMKALKVIY
jgi:hypothetical protein